jgi:hypothetical protein
VGAEREGRRECSRYDRTWFPGLYKQEIFIFILVERQYSGTEVKMQNLNLNLSGERIQGH